MEYTKGEWQADKKLIIAPNERILATVHNMILDNVGGDEAIANARLISAAPELYEALRYLLDFLGMPTDEWVSKYGAGVTQRQACDKARKALSKAEEGK